ncbi:MAG: BMP family ABC transporter substrate-binding protein [Bacillota bacterium]|nr:BMP family ABC transporter substrate-binding protein [Bacillota bacterium]
MKKNILLYLIVFVMVATLAVGCGQPVDEPEEPAENGESEEDVVKFAIIFGVGGLGDNGYNDEVNRGVKMAAEEFGAEYDYAEPQDISEFETQLRMFADAEEYDTIIAVSTEQAEALKMVAEEYPDQRFTMVDTKIDDMDNVHSISASHPEQHFLSGVLAGLATQDDRFPLSNPENILGFAIAMDTPTSRGQAAGFLAGAKYANPEVQILTNYIGGYNDPVTAKELALVMYERGADIVSVNAGSSSQGVFAAAKEKDRYVIGTSLAMVDPEVSLSTSVKKVWLFIVQEIESLYNGTWEPGFTEKGMAEGVTDYDVEGLDVEIPEDVIAKINEAREMVANGELVLPTDIDQVDAWAAENQME